MPVHIELWRRYYINHPEIIKKEHDITEEPICSCHKCDLAGILPVALSGPIVLDA